MTGFNTQVGGGVYSIQVVTDNKKVYMGVQDFVRSFIDQENAQEVVVSEMENTTHIEHSSVCGGVCPENTEVD